MNSHSLLNENLAAHRKAGFVARLKDNIRHLRAESKRLQRCGELAPPPSDGAHRQLMRVCRFFARAFIGKVLVNDSEGQNAQALLPDLKAPFVLALNHGSLLDVAVANLVLNRKTRHPAAGGVTKLFGGLAAYVASKWGIFTVELDNGGAARDAMVKVLNGGEPIFLFPEAWTYMDGKIGKFKTGTVRVAREASLNRAEIVPIIPAQIRYGRYPGAWIRKLPLLIQWLVPFLFAWRYRRGVTVVIGKPIDPLRLPADPIQATDVLKQAIIGLNPV